MWLLILSYSRKGLFYSRVCNSPVASRVYEVVVGKRAKKEYPELQAKNGEKKRPLTTSRARSGGYARCIWCARIGGSYMSFQRPSSLSSNNNVAQVQRDPCQWHLLLVWRFVL